MTAARRLAWSRRFLATVFLIRMTAIANLLPLPLAHVDGPLYGWPVAGQITIAWHHLVFPASITATLCLARTAAGVALLVGFRPRVAGLAAAILGVLVQSQDPFGAFYTLQLLYLAVATLALAEPDDLGLVRALVASVYLWSALAKLNGAWLDGYTLGALLTERQVFGSLAHAALASSTVRLAIACATPLVEAALGIAMVIGRARALRAAVIVAVLFHLTLEYALRPDVIGLLMASLLFAAWPQIETPSFVSTARRIRSGGKSP